MIELLGPPLNLETLACGLRHTHTHTHKQNTQRKLPSTADWNNKQAHN
jgi:hypothetical protein